MKNVEPADSPHLQHLYLFFYLIPIIGFFPSLWTLARHQTKDKQEVAIARLSVTLAVTWLLSYILLGFGGEVSEFLSLRLLLLNSFLTSGYFLVSLWLMVRLLTRQSPRLPGFSRLAERLFDKHLP